MAEFGVCRVDKLKSREHVVAALKHNQRVQGYDPKHVDPSGDCWELLDVDGRGKRFNVRQTYLDAEAYADRVFSGRTLRKGAIPAAEMVLSASPEYFRPLAPTAAGTYDPERLTAWRKAASKFLVAELGRENLISVTLQCDEATPHIQAIFVPKTTWSDQFGNDRGKQNGKHKLSALQDRYGEAMSKLGIERGVKREKPRRHQDVKLYYAAVNAALDAVQEPSRVDVPRDRGPLEPAAVEALLEQQREEDRRAYAPGADKFAEIMSIDRNAARAIDENVGLRAEVHRLRGVVDEQADTIGELQGAVTVWQEFAGGFVRVAQNALRRIGFADKLQPFTDALEELMHAASDRRAHSRWPRAPRGDRRPLEPFCGLRGASSARRRSMLRATQPATRGRGSGRHQADGELRETRPVRTPPAPTAPCAPCALCRRRSAGEPRGAIPSRRAPASKMLASSTHMKRPKARAQKAPGARLARPDDSNARAASGGLRTCFSRRTNDSSCSSTRCAPPGAPLSTRMLHRRTSRSRPGLNLALVDVGAGDTLVVSASIASAEACGR